MENNEEKVKEVSAVNETGVETEENTQENKKERVFDRAEVNKIIAMERQQEREKVLKEIEAKKAEADKLAKMDEDQKRSYELEQEKARANKAENELNAYRLKDETIRQASQRGISLGYIETIDFSRETAESINSKLDIFEKVSKADREKTISEYSKEPTPQTGERATQKDINQMSYTELAEYLNKHPEVNL